MTIILALSIQDTVLGCLEDSICHEISDINYTYQEELQGGRNHIWHRKINHFCFLLLIIIMYAQYFALLNYNLKLIFCAIACFSLLLILLGGLTILNK